MALHKNLTGSDLHEPKGLAAVTTVGKVYASDGVGSGTWTADLTPSTLNLTSNVYKTITIPWSCMFTVDRASHADFEKVNDDGSGSTGVFAAGFDGAGTDVEELCFAFGVPADYSEGTPINVYAIASMPNANAGGIVMALEWCLVQPETVMTNTTLSSNVWIATGVAKKPQRFDLESSIGGSDVNPNDVFSCRIYRTPNDASDTYASDCYIYAVQVTYEATRMGTTGELS